MHSDEIAIVYSMLDSLGVDTFVESQFVQDYGRTLAKNSIPSVSSAFRHDPRYVV